MKCIECGLQMAQGEMNPKDGLCWVCSAHVAQEVAQEAQAMDEEEAFRVLSTNELVEFGYISEETMAEMMAPWDSELPLAA